VFTVHGDTAIETYPKAVEKHARATPAGALAAEYARLHASLIHKTDDEESALWCALIAAAWSYALPGTVTLRPPPANTPSSEGWIWAP